MNRTLTPRPPVNFKILLDQVNNIRMALAIGEGKLEELPRGFPKHDEQCVLARALSNGWKAAVSDTIKLSNTKITREQHDACVKALKSLGFRVVDECHARNGRLRIQLIAIEPSRTMANFIERFDDGDFPDLILSD